MAEYVCKVGDSTGRIFQQVETAQSEQEVRQKLADKGFFVLAVHLHLGFLNTLGRSRQDRAVQSQDFLMFNQQFNTLIKAGLPILKALDLLGERTASARLRPLLADVRQRVREGTVLSEAFEAAGVFPKVYTTALLAGEKSGNLSGVLEDYIAYQRVTTGLKKKLIGVLIYPAILVGLGTIIISYLFTFVIPQFASLYHELGIPLPGPTQFLTTIVVDNRLWMFAFVGAVVASAVGIFVWSRTAKGGLEMDRMKLRLPVIGDTWIKFQVGQFARTLSTLLTGGTPLVYALETSASAITSRLVAGAVYQCAAKVREGESLHSSLLSTALMPTLALEMIEVGEASGALAPMLNSVAQFYEEETNLRISALLAVVEPAILVFMAVVIAFILIALYLPLFSVNVGGGGA
jgi:type IV pilus assembly protein PilC